METNIFARIQAVSDEIKTIEKSLNVSTGGSSSYKAVADLNVTCAIRKAEVNAGVVSIPIKQELVKSEIVTTKDKYGSEKINYVDVVKMTLRIYNIDKPEEYIDVESFGRGLDTGDKGFGKASTYARKYALLNAYKIATGEDPDEKASEDSFRANSSAQYIDDDLAFAIDEIKRAATGEELHRVWSTYKHYQTNPIFVTRKNERKTQLGI